MRIWLDDLRPAPDGFVWVKSYPEAIQTFKSYADLITDASLDHDLYGYSSWNWEDPTGYDFVQWMGGYDPFKVVMGEGEPDVTYWPSNSLAVHTDNPGGRKNMTGFIERYGPYTTKKLYSMRYGNDGYGLAQGFIYSKEDEDASEE